jgi:ribonucleotide monophosphatase NagD (HAD superfamily)
MRLTAVLVDLSGTLHVGSSPLPGAVQALQRLRQHPDLKVTHAAAAAAAAGNMYTQHAYR